MNEENRNMSKKKDGHLDDNSLAFAAEWLSGKKVNLPPEIEEHLKNCSHCKNEVLEISELINENVSHDKHEIDPRDKFEETCAAKYSPSIKHVSSTQFWRVAAVFLVLITITSLAIFVKPDRKEYMVSNELPSKSEVLDSLTRDSLESSRIEGLKDSVVNNEGVKVESIEKDKFADNYIPNAGLESLIGAQFRSGENPEVISPGADTLLVCGAKLKFSGINPVEENLEIQILDNRGELKSNYQDIKVLATIVSLDLDPGLYYWKLMGEDELYQVGKIILKKK